MQMISFPENQSGTFPATGVLALLFDATTTEPLNQTVIVEPVTLLAGEPAGPAREFPLTFERLGEGSGATAAADPCRGAASGTQVGPRARRLQLCELSDWQPVEHRLTYAGNRICFRRLLSKAEAGTKRRSRLTWRAIRPAA